MTLGEFIENFSQNNIIRLVYKFKSGHETVMPTWQDVSMDWEVNKQKGCFRHFINNKVLGLAGICVCGGDKYPEAINIVIERLDNQPLIEESLEEVKLEGYLEVTP